MIYNTNTQKKELYDLENDPGEKDNCLDRYPLVADNLWEKLEGIF